MKTLVIAFTLMLLMRAPAGMVKIPAGEFKPFVLVSGRQEMKRVHSFLLDEHAVTNAEYLAFVRNNPQWRRGRVPRVFADSNYLKQWAGDLEIGALQNPNGPVTNISWFAADAYCKWLGKRLPTLDEWEYAGGAAPMHSAVGENLSRIILQWYDHPTPTVLPAVKSTYENKLGLWDMHGLVWEWVEDFNSVMPQGGNFYCGGGAAGTANREDYAAYMRYAFRGSLQASYTVASLGFRCAKDIK
jgi:formylglycine-generating enzyme required for sulfatase activity